MLVDINGRVRILIPHADDRAGADAQLLNGLYSQGRSKSLKTDSGWCLIVSSLKDRLQSF